MAYNCQSCVSRKVKCDRGTPTCSSCLRSKRPCLYQAPSKPRRKKRKGNPDESEMQVPAPEREESVLDRLARYERILRRNGLLETDATSGVAPASVRKGGEDAEGAPPAASSHDRELLLTSREAIGTPLSEGKLVSGADGKSRYIESSLWLDTVTDDVQEFTDDADGAHDAPTGLPSMALSYDPISGALLGHSQDLLEFHPSHEDAMKLWTTHVENVEPLCRILHVPSTAKMLDAVSRQPSTATRSQECQLFAIYHFAVYSMPDEDCLRLLGQRRSDLLVKYEHAMRQALVNASWLKTTEMPVMQALTLFLMSGRGSIDPHTFWMLTGIAVRIAQRMGLHRDGEALGLPPFEVQMRRRLFWQIIPIDGFAGQHSGTGISMPPNSWEVKKPLNIGDDQIYPGMTHQPEEQAGATDMIYVLARAELTEFYSKKAATMRDGRGPSLQIRPSEENARFIDEVEQAIESKYLRYCDIISESPCHQTEACLDVQLTEPDPVHYFVHIIVRSAVNVVRLRGHMLPLRGHALDDKERRALCGLAQRILDSDNAIYRNAELRRFRWHASALYLQDAFLCVLTSLMQPGFFTRAEVDTAWRKLGDVWEHHTELLSTDQPIHVSACKTILEAWAANPTSDAVPEPAFVSKVRAARNRFQKIRAGGGRDDGPDRQINAEDAAPLDWATSGSSDVNGVAGVESVFSDSAGVGVGEWFFWDQFFRNAGPSNV